MRLCAGMRSTVAINPIPIAGPQECIGRTYQNELPRIRPHSASDVSKTRLRTLITAHSFPPGDSHFVACMSEVDADRVSRALRRRVWPA